MAKSRAPVTAAVRALRTAGIIYTEHLYRYEDHQGAAGGAAALDVDVHRVVKTLVMEDDSGASLIVLMHGDREVSTKQLARALGVKWVSPCDPSVAQRQSGYRVGGTSPFGLRRRMPVVMERTIAHLDRIYVNGGKRGFLVGLDVADLMTVLAPTLVDVAIE